MAVGLCGTKVGVGGRAVEVAVGVTDLSGVLVGAGEGVNTFVGVAVAG